MSEPLVRLNPTRLRRFYRCEYEWYAYAVLGIDRLRPPPSPHRDRGKAFHALLEYALHRFAETGKPYTFAGDAGKLAARSVLYDLYKAEGTSLDEGASYEILDAARFQLERLDLAAYEVARLPDGTPLIEADLRADLLPDVQLQAKVDIVLRHHASGKLWLIDFKTTVNPIDTHDVPPWIELEDQLGMGRFVLAANGVPVDHSALVHLRSLAPSKPPLVYKGKPRERTTYNVNAMACDWETYRATLIERAEDPDSAEAQKVREALMGQAFVRWQSDFTGESGEQAMQANWERAAKRMLALVRGDDKPIRRLVQTRYGSCRRCDYGSWCRAALRNKGEPDLAVLGTDYEARDHSPYAGRETDSPLFNPADAYVRWAEALGRNIAPHEEFRP